MWGSGNFQQPALCLRFVKHKSLPLLIHSHSNAFSNCASFFRNSLLLFIFLAVFLLLKVISFKKEIIIHVYHLFLLMQTWLQGFTAFLLWSGDVELNPGPKPKSSNASISHWNLNSISVHNYPKVFLHKVYIAIHRFIICMSETYPYSSTPSDVNNLEISVHTLVLSDHPSNNKKRCVCSSLLQKVFTFKNCQCPIFKIKYLFWT